MNINDTVTYFVGYEDIDGFWSCYETKKEQDAKEAFYARRKTSPNHKWSIYKQSISFVKQSDALFERCSTIKDLECWRLFDQS